MPRPTDNVEWAPNADADDVEEPTAERDRGYQDGEDLPNEQLNWLLRALGAWVQYFDDQFNGATGLIDFFTGIAFGSNGDWVKNVDDASDYEAEMTHTGSGDATLVADFHKSNTATLTDAIRGDSDNTVDVERTDGASGGGGLLLQYLRGSQTEGSSGTTTDVVDIQDQAGNTGAGGILVDLIQPENQQWVRVDDNADVTQAAENGGMWLSSLRSGQSSDFISVYGSGGVGSQYEGIVAGRNMVRAHCAVDGVNGILVSGGVNVSSVTRNGPGDYDVVIGQPANQDFTGLHPVVSIYEVVEGNAHEYGAVPTQDGDDTIHVDTYDSTGTQADASFYLHVCFATDGTGN